jgi:hypothetical protein
MQNWVKWLVMSVSIYLQIIVMISCNFSDPTYPIFPKLEVPCINTRR